MAHTPIITFIGAGSTIFAKNLLYASHFIEFLAGGNGFAHRLGSPPTCCFIHPTISGI
jgi:hypothetical protein